MKENYANGFSSNNHYQINKKNNDNKIINEKIENFLAHISSNTKIDLNLKNTSNLDLELNSDIYSDHEMNSQTNNNFNEKYAKNNNENKNKKLMLVIKTIKTNVLKSDEKANELSLKSKLNKLLKEDIDADLQVSKNDSKTSMLKLEDFGFKNRNFEHNSNFNIFEVFDIDKVKNNKSVNNKANQSSDNFNLLKRKINKVEPDSTIKNSSNNIYKIKGLGDKIICSDKIIDLLNKRFDVKDNLERQRFRTHTKQISQNSLFINNEENYNNEKHQISQIGKFKIITRVKNDKNQSENSNRRCKMIIRVFFLISSIAILILITKNSSFANYSFKSLLKDTITSYYQLELGLNLQIQTLILFLSALVFIATLIFLFNSYKSLNEKKNNLIVLWVIQRIIADLVYKKFIEKQEDPEIDADDFAVLLSNEFSMDESYIRENIINKIGAYFEENQESNVMQLNFYIKGKIRSIWKLKEI